MKLVFHPSLIFHPHVVEFPIYFVVSEKLSVAPELNFSGIPLVVVYANTAHETQLPVGVDFEVTPMIDSCLQVNCRETKDGVVSLAIQAALIAFSPNFEGYDVAAKFTLTP